MTVVARKSTPNGEVRHLRSEGTSSIVEYESNGHVFRTDFDPRETGSHLFISLYAWAEPEGERIATDRYDEILDALWQITSSVRATAIIERKVDPECYVAERWSYPDGHVLARIDASFIEALELRRTSKVRYHEKEGAPADRPVAIPLAETAAWRFPTQQPLTSHEWDALFPKLRAVTPKNLILTDYEWRIDK